jgi:hypothetical protein
MLAESSASCTFLTIVSLAKFVVQFVPESASTALKKDVHPQINPDYIFALAGYPTTSVAFAKLQISNLLQKLFSSILSLLVKIALSTRLVTRTRQATAR